MTDKDPTPRADGVSGGDPGDRMLVGAHVSVKDGLANAFANGERVGATCIQIFTRNVRQWEAPPLETGEVEDFHKAWAASSVREVMCHDSYLINLGNPDPEKLQRSRVTLAAEAERCNRLGIRLLNFHPGAHLDSGREACIERVAESIAWIMERDGGTRLIYTLENTVGHGTSVGGRLEDLQAILEMVGQPERTGVCIDTCHLFAAGYDILSEAGWAAFWDEFEARIGLKSLRAFHVNDAARPLGSRLDRHEDLGAGHMGWPVFERLAADSRFHGVPMFLETPGGDEVWREQIRLLRGARRNGAGTA
jgi:deoxyribonuclease-4